MVIILAKGWWWWCWLLDCCCSKYSTNRLTISHLIACTFARDRNVFTSPWEGCVGAIRCLAARECLQSSSRGLTPLFINQSNPRMAMSSSSAARHSLAAILKWWCGANVTGHYQGAQHTRECECTVDSAAVTL